MSREDKSRRAFYRKMKARADATEPRMISASGDHAKRGIVEDVLPDGATLPPMNKTSAAFSPWSGTSSFSGGGGSSIFHTQRPYLPEFDSPDRQFYPKDRLTANKYWRLFYKSDPIFGTAVEMYSQMMTSDFDIILENENDTSIKNQLMDMVQDTFFLQNFQHLIKEFLVVGEAFPHLFFDEEKGVWSYIGFHNPDYIDVQDSPIIDMDPIISFIPDEHLRQMLTDNSPESLELRQKLPPEFVSKVLANQKIRLSPLNCSYIPRKLHPYDERGVSLASRLWRIWMVEDAVYNATIAIFRRHASPLKILKLGDPSTGWIPGPETEQKLLNMVTQAEMDPNSWIVYNYGVNFETWGTTDRAITISREHDTIEKVKLLALGLSKGFMSGEVSFSSVKGGLQVFLRRLLSMRQYFESTWMMPKYFDPIVQINDWVKSTPSEVNHRYRIKRTAQEKHDQNLYISPKIKWRNKLDPSIDEETLRAYGQLKAFGFDISNDSIGSSVSLDWKNELEKHATEFKDREEILTKILGPALKSKYEQANAPQQAKPPGTAGAGAKPPSAGGVLPTGLTGKLPVGGQPGESHPPGSGPAEGTGPLNDGIDSPGGGETSL